MSEVAKLELADEVRQAAARLNAAIRSATIGGLKIGLTISTSEGVDKYPITVVTASKSV